MRFFTSLVEQLNDAGVRYAVVGGMAVVLHGHSRLTGDVDIVLVMNEENVKRAVEVFLARNMRPRVPVDIADLADDEKRTMWIESKGLMAFTMYDPQEPGAVLDVLLHGPVDFEDMVKSCVLKPFGRSTVPVASIQHLIAMKEAAGRPQDLSDIEALRTLADG